MEDNFENFMLVFAFDNPGVNIDEFLGDSPFINHYVQDWNCLIPVMDKIYQEHMSTLISEAMLTFDIKQCYAATVVAISEYNLSNG